MTTQPEPPSLRALFTGILSISVLGFGGVMPWARRLIVDQRRWMTAAEFNDTVALCQFLPGPNMINFSVAMGARFHGGRGALVCLAALVGAPFLIISALGLLYARYGAHPEVARAFHGLAAAASGLVLATALRMAAPLRGSWRAMAMAGVALVAIAVLRLPLLPCLAVLAPVGIAVQWRITR